MLGIDALADALLVILLLGRIRRALAAAPAHVCAVSALLTAARRRTPNLMSLVSVSDPLVR